MSGEIYDPGYWSEFEVCGPTPGQREVHLWDGLYEAGAVGLDLLRLGEGVSQQIGGKSSYGLSFYPSLDMTAEAFLPLGEISGDFQRFFPHVGMHVLVNKGARGIAIGLTRYPQLTIGRDRQHNRPTIGAEYRWRLTQPGGKGLFRYFQKVGKRAEVAGFVRPYDHDYGQYMELQEGVESLAGLVNYLSRFLFDVMAGRISGEVWDKLGSYPQYPVDHAITADMGTGVSRSEIDGDTFRQLCYNLRNYHLPSEQYKGFLE